MKYFLVNINAWCIGLILSFYTISTTAQTIDSLFIDGVVYVKTSDTSTVELAPYNCNDSAFNSLFNIYDIDTIIKPFPGLNNTLDKTYRIVFQQTTLIENFIIDLASLPFIEYAEKAPLYQTNFVPNDFQEIQWALTKIQAEQAWDISKGSNSISIAIVDNAVSTTHQDLAANIWVNTNEIPGNNIDDDLNGFIDDVNGWDVADGDNNPNPPSSANSSSLFVHGTHCAGIAAATTNNSIGIASIGYNTQIIPVKCSKDNSSDQGASLPNAYDGLYYAIKANANIISMSWGGSSGIFTTGESLINAANALGITLVAAAGNNNSQTPFYPASYNHVISVGSTNQDDQKSGFSNYGVNIDVMAPGSGIYSTLSGADNAYGYLSGTSMACPLVAGLCGLILSQNINFTTDIVEYFLKEGCDNIDFLNPDYTDKLGAGRINAYGSLLKTSINIVESKGAVEVFPNPNRGSFNLISKNLNNCYISIFDGNGKLVFSKNQVVNDGPLEVDVALLPGFYLLNVSNSDSNYFKKLIIY